MYFFFYFPAVVLQMSLLLVTITAYWMVSLFGRFDKIIFFLSFLNLLCHLQPHGLQDQVLMEIFPNITAVLTL